MTSKFTHCDCGRRLAACHLAHHKRHTCPAVPREGHCAYCRQPAVAAILAKLREGMVPEQAAQDLRHEAAYVLEVRTRARSHGCLPPAPKRHSPEWHADRAARAKFVMGERTCIECNKVYTPVLGAVHQGSCSTECHTTRRNRLKRKDRAAASARPRVVKNTVDEGKEERAMMPAQEREAFIKAEAERLGAIIEANRERQFQLFMSLMGVAA